MIFICVGHNVIYRKTYGSRPLIAEVTKRTPKQRLHIKLPGSIESIGPFKPTGPDSDVYEMDSLSSRYSPQTVVPYSDATLAKWNKEADELEASNLEKKRIQEERKREAEERRSSELQTVKTACNGILPIKYQEVFPDGSRLFVMNIPVDPKLMERKKGFETIVARLVDGEDYNYQTTQRGTIVRLYASFCNGNNEAFPSCSGTSFKTDEDALWDAIRYRYHDNW